MSCGSCARRSIAAPAPQAEHEPDGNVVHELGDLLFAAVNVARHANVDPELALRAAADRFRTRVELAADWPKTPATTGPTWISTPKTPGTAKPRAALQSYVGATPRLILAQAQACPRAARGGK